MMLAAAMKGITLSQFEALGLSSNLLKSVLALGYETPTPIQVKAIPLVLQGRDVMGLAQTGTGKTAAFGLPLIQHLLADDNRATPRNVRALILAPTRELVNQIASNLRDYARRQPLRVEVVVGGASINNQIKALARGCDILVATPGRLIDLIERRAVFLDKARFLVLDEADQMLDLGFIHSLRRIAKLVGRPRQTMLFSATMPKQIEELSQAYLTDPVRIEVAPPGRAADKVRQSVHFTGARSKVDLLKSCLAERPDDLSLVFARTKHGAEKLMKALVASGFDATSIHGNKSQGQRERAIKAFRQGEVRVLVATDVAARGIDIPGVSHVYNFDLPEVPENYVHRIGRTARAGAGGEAVAFCGPEDLRLLRDIERLMSIKIDVASGEAPVRGSGGTAKPPARGRNGNPHRGQAWTGAETDKSARPRGGKTGWSSPSANADEPAGRSRSGTSRTRAASADGAETGGAKKARAKRPQYRGPRDGESRSAPITDTRSGHRGSSSPVRFGANPSAA
jgi:ATP-dependent RNA helicase RhlE